MYRILFLSIVLLSACKQSTSVETTDGLFSIYKLKDSTITAHAAFAMPLENLVLADAPFLSASDLKTYTWSTHSFELTAETSAKWEEFGRNHGKTSGVPFVVTVGKERIYIGTFWWSYSSMMPPPTAVIDITFSFTKLTINLASGAADKRSHSRIHNSLKQSTVLVE